MRSGSSRYPQARGLLPFERFRLIRGNNPFRGWARDLCRFEEGRFYWTRDSVAPGRRGAHAALSRSKIASQIPPSSPPLFDFGRIRGGRLAYQRHTIATSGNRYWPGLRKDSIRKAGTTGRDRRAGPQISRDCGKKTAIQEKCQYLRI